MVCRVTDDREKVCHETDDRAMDVRVCHATGDRERVCHATGVMVCHEKDDREMVCRDPDVDCSAGLDCYDPEHGVVCLVSEVYPVCVVPDGEDVGDNGRDVVHDQLRQ